MPLQPGTRLGPYEVTAPIGAGGMGEVYKARDTRLERTVAIKVLPARFADDPQLQARFEREARAIAALSHPHICTLHDVGHEHGTAYLVMEYLEGDTLAMRLDKGALPLDQALTIAIEIAAALDKAHRSGIVHRDLKPGNIMLTRTGAKLLDFGLAKATAGVVAGDGLSMLPTTPANLTAQGAILGTFQYMAPEQLEGHEADARSDIFAFGAVCYETVTGRKAFTGKSQASLISSIMSSDPPAMTSVQLLTPPALDHIVSRCLAKDPNERWQSIGDVMRELRWVVDAAKTNPSAPSPSTIGTRPRWRSERVAWVATAVLATIAIALAARAYIWRAPPDDRVQKFSILPPPNTRINRESLAMSPDGRFLAFVAANIEGRSQLWLRSLDGLSARPLPGTDDARYPFWSPDGRFIAFFAEGKLKKIRPTGGPAQAICDASYGFGGTWNRDGVILFAPDSGRTLYRVSANGGAPFPATTLDAERGEASHWSPTFLPDGRHFLYVAGGRTSSIDIGALDSVASRRLVDTDSVALYAPGYLVYVHNNALLAQPFDADRGEITGDAVPVGDGEIPTSGIGKGAPISLTGTSVLAYGSSSTNTQLVWFDRSGTRLATLGAPDRYDSVEIAPDGKRVAVERLDPRKRMTNVWLVGVGGDSATEFTFAGGNHPRWSPDGQFLTFETGGGIRRKRVDGNGTEETLYQPPAGVDIGAVSDWSPDGRALAIRQIQRGKGSGAGSLYILPLTAGAIPTSVPQTDARGMNGRFSPDGRWLAYTTEESGIPEVYVQPFPGTGAKWLVSRGGGIRPRWRSDGKELFYVASGAINGVGRLMAVSIQPEPVFRVGTPTPLLDLAFAPPNANCYPYGISADGQRVLAILPQEDQARSSITVVLNWTGQLKQN